MPNELIAEGKVAVSVFLDSVTLEISVGDEYAAQSLFDEIIERLQHGEGLNLNLKQPEQRHSRD